MSFSATAVLGQFFAQHGIHGEKATYRVGNHVIEDLDVIPGKSEAQAIGPDDLVTTVDLQDFQLRAGDLLLPGTEPPLQFIPDRGHIIEVVRGGQVVQFTVNHPNLNEAPYKRSDAYGAVLRVHTLQVEPSIPAE